MSLLLLSHQRQRPLTLRTVLAKIKHMGHAVSSKRTINVDSKAEVGVKVIDDPSPYVPISPSSIKPLFLDETNSAHCSNYSLFHCRTYSCCLQFKEKEVAEENTYYNIDKDNETHPAEDCDLLLALERGLDALFFEFEKTVASLQKEPSCTDLPKTTISDIEERRSLNLARGMSMNNAEATSVNAYLCGTAELISNLKSLTVTVRQMEAYGVIRASTGGKKYL